jgi:hypothetical protein
MKNSFLITFTAINFLLAGCCISPHHKKWEYMQTPTQLSDKELNKLGDQGWNVVGCGSSQTGTFYILKRAKQ